MLKALQEFMEVLEAWVRMLAPTDNGEVEADCAGPSTPPLPQNDGMRSRHLHWSTNKCGLVELAW